MAADRVTRYAHLTPARELGVNVLDILLRILRLEGTERGDQYDILCPAHHETHPSASVNLTTGYWHCLACGAGGDLIRLTARVLDIDIEHATDMLLVRTPTALLARLESLQEQARPTPRSSMVDVPVPHHYAAGPLDELIARGFTPRTLRRWSVRYVSSETLDGGKGPFNIYASVGIPVMDERARVLFWCYRRTAQSADWQQRYLYSGGATLLRTAWFGAQHHQRGDIVIVEGALDAMWCDQCGVPALALLGASMGMGKLRWVADRFDTVTLFGDDDVAGVRWVNRLGAALVQTGVSVRVCQYPRRLAAKDPQECAAADLATMVARAPFWARFRERQIARTRP